MYKKVYFLIVCLLFVTCQSDTDIDVSSFDIDNINLDIINSNDWELSSLILNKINNHRNHLEKPILRIDSLYASAYAIQHTKYMIEMNEVNHHRFFLRSNALKEHGAVTVSEVVAYGYHSATSVVNAWLNSSNHKKVLEGDFTHVGFGIEKTTIDDGIYFTLLFYK